MKPKQILQWIISAPIMPVVLGVAGMGVYLVLSWGHAHGQVSVIDEGLYLFKGYLFTTGEYTPFQDYGPLTNHMPLSFLIPGYIQRLFGAGIRTGRMLAIVLGMGMLPGIWLLTNRLAGGWWATAAIWAINLNSALIKVYSQAVSQVLVACLLIWVIVLATGEDRRFWQIMMSVVLSVVLLFTRLNMAPVLPIIILYVFWHDGKGRGWLALGVGLALVVIGHLIFWPDILKLWANWIPRVISPFLDPYRLELEVLPYWDPNTEFSSRVGSLIMTIKMHLLPILGALGALFTLAKSGEGRVFQTARKQTWLLVSLFFVLFIAHAIAALGLNYCVYCLRNYAAFFFPVGLVLLALVAVGVQGMSVRLGKVVLLGTMIAIPFVFNFSLGEKLAVAVLSTDVSKLSGLMPQNGTTLLINLLQVKFGLSTFELMIAVRALIYLLLIVAPVLTILIQRYTLGLGRGRDSEFTGTVSTFLSVFLVIEMGLSTVYFSNEYYDFDCGEDAIAANESTGAYLAQNIPVGSSIYWDVGRSPVPLLYLPGRRIYPSQLNGDYTFMLSGDPEHLERLGYWNRSLANRWLVEADYVLVEERVYPRLIERGFEETFYDEITRAPPNDLCRKNSAIMIFKNERGLE